jgi:hypothetical protein
MTGRSDYYKIFNFIVQQNNTYKRGREGSGGLLILARRELFVGEGV